MSGIARLLDLFIGGTLIGLLNIITSVEMIHKLPSLKSNDG